MDLKAQIFLMLGSIFTVISGFMFLNKSIDCSNNSFLESYSLEYISKLICNLIGYTATGLIVLFIGVLMCTLAFKR